MKLKNILITILGFCLCNALLGRYEKDIKSYNVNSEEVAEDEGNNKTRGDRIVEAKKDRD